MNGWNRAQVMLGTLVTVQVAPDTPQARAHRAMDAALARMAHIARVMSAHDPLSDLGRLCRAQAHQVLTLDPDTVQVLRAARDWTLRSGGAFDPVRAADALVRRGARPGLRASVGDLSDLELLSDTVVQVAKPIAIDLGGIAKGYAVDRAMDVLRQHQVTQARVNAGGDLAVMGPAPQRIVLRHAGAQARSHMRGALMGRQGAVATSIAVSGLSEFVAHARRRRMPWHSATVSAHDCMSADALTKWALHSSLLCPVLTRTLREHGATLWRSR